MKSALIAILSLSSLNAFAAARIGDNPAHGEGRVSVFGMRGTLNVVVQGQAAKVLFDNLNDAKETNTRMGSLFLTRRESANLACSFSAEVAMTYECRFHVDTRGVVTAGTVAFTRDIRPGDHSVSAEGVISVGGKRGTMNADFSGQAAKLIFDHLTEARETSRRIGSLFLTERRSSDLLATFSAEVAMTYQVSFHVASNGDVLADGVMFTM